MHVPSPIVQVSRRVPIGCFPARFIDGIHIDEDTTLVAAIGVDAKCLNSFLGVRRCRG
jgi:hypothetical protein